MLKMLKMTISRQTTNEVQAGAVLSVVDAYDRGVDRQTFLRILNEAVMLYDYLGCLSTVGRIQDIFIHDNLTADRSLKVLRHSLKTAECLGISCSKSCSW